MENIGGFNPDCLAVYSGDALKRIQCGDASWERMVPPPIAEVIKAKSVVWLWAKAELNRSNGADYCGAVRQVLLAMVRPAPKIYARLILGTINTTNTANDSFARIYNARPFAQQGH